jgi:hypothetical protein
VCSQGIHATVVLCFEIFLCVNPETIGILVPKSKQNRKKNKIGGSEDLPVFCGRSDKPDLLFNYNSIFYDYFYSPVVTP